MRVSPLSVQRVQLSRKTNIIDLLVMDTMISNFYVGK